MEQRPNMSTIYIYTVYFGGPNRHIYKSRISPFCRRYLSPPTHWRHSVATSRDQKIPHTHTHCRQRLDKMHFLQFLPKDKSMKNLPVAQSNSLFSNRLCGIVFRSVFQNCKSFIYETCVVLSHLTEAQFMFLFECFLCFLYNIHNVHFL